MDEKDLVGRTRMENWGGAVLEKEAGRTRPRCQWMISFPREAGDTVSNEIFSRRTEEGRCGGLNRALLPLWVFVFTLPGWDIANEMKTPVPGT